MIERISRPAARTLAEQLVRQRTRLGLSQKESAGRIGVDPGTLAKWERGERQSAGAFLGCVKRFLQDGKASGAWGSDDHLGSAGALFRQGRFGS
jgi:DNA-binding transcriptional regulator YiaG